MRRLLLSLAGFLAVAYVWASLVGWIGVFSVQNPKPPTGSDTYFITSSWIYWAVVILPLCLFAIWYFRRIVGRAA